MKKNLLIATAAIMTFALTGCSKASPMSNEEFEGKMQNAAAYVETGEPEAYTFKMQESLKAKDDDSETNVEETIIMAWSANAMYMASNESIFSFKHEGDKYYGYAKTSTQEAAAEIPEEAYTSYEDMMKTYWQTIGGAVMELYASFSTEEVTSEADVSVSYSKENGLYTCNFSMKQKAETVEEGEVAAEESGSFSLDDTYFRSFHMVATQGAENRMEINMTLDFKYDVPSVNWDAKAPESDLQ